ncbi:hypothetical protein AAF712_009886 [Marasmius tenuissimus]|uniref:Uncharacterized protein n=1 Tax=Marasmius tenuissimus TaxID=585030 RepID=A0ABR2ZH63_9AGAR|nr:hypothetical protein PM082_021254 [Marasmius tenuissimus]KAJ8075633.1 hypothetical protein PM082_021263 [Marasmius tenuissimus]
MSSIRELLQQYVQDHPDNAEAQTLAQEAAKDLGDKPGANLRVVNDKVSGLTWWFKVVDEDGSQRTFVGSGAGSSVNGHGYFTATDTPSNIQEIGTKGTFTLTTADGGGNVTLKLKGENDVEAMWTGQGSSLNIPANSKGSWTAAA